MKILGFAGSNSSISINKKLVEHVVASYFYGNKAEVLDLNDYEMSLYSLDREKQQGIPPLAFGFAQKIDESDLLIVSLAEHNGAYSAAFKNLFDWVSRIPTRKVFGEKPMFLLATSPGQRGGASVLEIAQKRFPFNGGKILDTFSLPNFYTNFNDAQGIINDELKQLLEGKVQLVKAHFKE